MTRRFMSVAVLATAGALALSACGGSSSGSNNASNNGSSSGGKTTYTIALQGPLSGGNAQLGLNIKYGVELAINQANAGKTFGSLPFTLKYAEADDQGSPTTAPSAAQSLIGNSSVIAVVGPIFSGATRASEPFYSQASLASVTPSATAVDLTTHNWSNFFRAIAPDNIQGKADADYTAKVVKAKSVYVIDDASTYGLGLAQNFIPEAKSDGMTVTHQTAPGTTQCQAGTGNVQQYSALSTQIKSANPGEVFYAGYYCDFALLSKALRATGYTGQLFSDDGSEDSHYISEAGANVANGALLSCACADITKIPAAASFISDYTKLANQPPAVYSAEGYDVTNAIITVLKGAAAQVGSGKVTRSDVVQGMSKVSYQGLTKTIAFGSDHNISGTAIYIYKVENGKITQLGLASNLIH